MPRTEGIKNRLQLAVERSVVFSIGSSVWVCPQDKLATSNATELYRRFLVAFVLPILVPDAGKVCKFSSKLDGEAYVESRQ